MTRLIEFERCFKIFYLELKTCVLFREIFFLLINEKQTCAYLFHDEFLSFNKFEKYLASGTNSKISANTHIKASVGRPFFDLRIFTQSFLKLLLSNHLKTNNIFQQSQQQLLKCRKKKCLKTCSWPFY